MSGDAEFTFNRYDPGNPGQSVIVYARIVGKRKGIHAIRRTCPYPIHAIQTEQAQELVRTEEKPFSEQIAVSELDLLFNEESQIFLGEFEYESDAKGWIEVAKSKYDLDLTGKIRQQIQEHNSQPQTYGTLHAEELAPYLQYNMVRPMALAAQRQDQELETVTMKTFEAFFSDYPIRIDKALFREVLLRDITDQIEKMQNRVLLIKGEIYTEQPVFTPTGIKKILETT